MYNFKITSPSKEELNILNVSEIKSFLTTNTFHVLIHTAIKGGRRLTDDVSDDFYKNILMFENILTFADKFKMIINLDSGAIYDRNTDILNRSEDELYTVPKDYYGLSKYVIYKRTLEYSNIYNFRIFNIFHSSETIGRFIRMCFMSKYYNETLTIPEDKYFDFMYKDDFIKIVLYYINNLNTQHKLEKTMNICYKEKYKLSDIANIICKADNINILNTNLYNNYCGNNTKLDGLDIKLDGLKNGLLMYENVFKLTH